MTPTRTVVLGVLLTITAAAVSAAIWITFPPAAASQSLPFVTRVMAQCATTSGAGCWVTDPSMGVNCQSSNIGDGQVDPCTVALKLPLSPLPRRFSAAQYGVEIGWFLACIAGVLWLASLRTPEPIPQPRRVRVPAVEALIVDPSDFVYTQAGAWSLPSPVVSEVMA